MRVRALSSVVSCFSLAMLFKRVCASEALQSLAPSLCPYVTAYSLTLLKFLPSALPSLLSVVLYFSLFWCLHLALCFPPFPFSSSGPSPPPPLASALPFCSPDKSPVLLSPLSLSPANFTPTLSLSIPSSENFYCAAGRAFGAPVPPIFHLFFLSSFVRSYGGSPLSPSPAPLPFFSPPCFCPLSLVFALVSLQSAKEKRSTRRCHALRADTALCIRNKTPTEGGEGGRSVR